MRKSILGTKLFLSLKFCPMNAIPLIINYIFVCSGTQGKLGCQSLKVEVSGQGYVRGL